MGIPVKYPPNVTTDVMYTPSTLIPALRATGASKSQIARWFGVSHVSVQAWLSGVNRPSRMACTLARYVLSQAGYVGAGLPSIGGQTAGNRRGVGVVPVGPALVRKSRRC